MASSSPLRYAPDGPSPPPPPPPNLVLQPLSTVPSPPTNPLDCDGVLVDTEKDGHRVTFNQAFAQKGLSTVWDEKLYGVLLETGGGKERMHKYFSDFPNEEPYKSLPTEEAQWAWLREMHALKTELFMDLISRGEMPLRPGVKARSHTHTHTHTYTYNSF